MLASRPVGPTPTPRLSKQDSLFLDRLRGISVSRVVLGHLGLFWLFPPYTSFLMALLPLLFFVSGAVTFLSWRRSTSDGAFIIHRLVGIFVPYWLFVGLALAYHCISSGAIPSWNTQSFIDWLLINPSHSKMPFPIGQVWFLHALVIMMLLAPAIFRLIEAKRELAFAVIAFSLALCTAQLFLRVDREIVVLGHNTYQAFSNLGFFAFGAYYFGFEERPRRRHLALLFVLFISLAVGLGHFVSPRVDFKYHSFAPDLYYIAACYAALTLVLVLQHEINYCLGVLSPLDHVFRFVSNHSYSVFLLHSFFIFGAESWLGLVDVASDPMLAAAKIALVAIATAAAAIPFSNVSRRLTSRIDKLIRARLR